MNNEQRILNTLHALANTVTDFRIEVAGTLGGIQAQMEAHEMSAVAHFEEDDDRFEELTNKIHAIELDTEIAKRVGGAEGGKLGRRGGLAVGAIIVTIAESVRAWFGG